VLLVWDLHSGHKQQSSVSYDYFRGSTVVKYSEKKRSPLSGGNVSAFGKAIVRLPASVAILLMCDNSRWLK
jgi:hypothetical protein